jgi:hypothetical protein
MNEICRKDQKQNLSSFKSMEQHALENVHCLSTNIYSYLETSGGQSSSVYLNAVHFFQQQC